MTVQEFKKYNAERLNKIFMQDASGQQLMTMVGSLIPAYEFQEKEHLLIEARGARRGYELCMRNIMYLCTPEKPEANTEPIANYGVNEETPKQ